jgi:hypothetical protein
MPGHDIALDLIAARVDQCRPGTVVVRERINREIRPRAGNRRRFATADENKFAQAANRSAAFTGPTRPDRAPARHLHNRCSTAVRHANDLLHNP